MAPHGPVGNGWHGQDEVPTLASRGRGRGPLGVVHAHQLRWHPFARFLWWMFLLPLAIFAWSSWRLHGFPRAIGYVLAGFVLLFGVAAFSAPPPPPATTAAPIPLVATTTTTTGSAVTAPALPLQPVYTPPVPVVTSQPSTTARRVTPQSTYSTPAGPRTTVRVPSAGRAYGDTYTNVDGNQVQRPVAGASQPSGATAKCKDGTWSFSQHRSGTCSGHGGVAEWL